MGGFFSQFGEVTNVRLSRSKRTGRSKGYAFVEFAEHDVRGRVECVVRRRAGEIVTRAEEWRLVTRAGESVTPRRAFEDFDHSSPRADASVSQTARIAAATMDKYLMGGKQLANALTSCRTAGHAQSSP